MSDEQKPNSGTPAAAPAADPLKNMKAEFDRKIANLEATNRKMLDQVIAMQAKAAPAQPQAKDVETAWFDNPRQAAEIIKEEIRQEQVAAARTNNTIAKLVEEFPELRDEEADLTKRAVQIYEGFSPSDKSSPLAYRTAVREAAQELGVQPVSKRKVTDESDEEFSLSGSGSVRSQAGGRRRDSLDPKTVEFARLMGLDVDKTEVKERLKSHQKRSWKNYGK